MTELKDWLNSINQNKKNIMDNDLSTEKTYPPYIINKCLSSHIDSIMFANEININHHIAKKLQYDFYINSLRIRTRFAPWISKDKIEDLDLIKKYYGYSNEKAHQALKILNKDQIKYIKSKFDTGGLK